jgi:hypothetical protein
MNLHNDHEQVGQIAELLEVGTVCVHEKKKIM